MYTNDYIMRQIEIISQVLAGLIFHKKRESEEISAFRDAFAQGDLLALRLRELLDAGKINDAENLIFEALDETPDPAYLSAALDFYRELAEMTDESLEASGFSRDEIYEGLSALEKIFLPGI